MNITITDRDDGFGAQYQHIIYGIIYAEMNNSIYIHKPISKMAHNYENDPDFVSKMEDFINIKNHYKNIYEESNYTVIDFWTLYNFITHDFNYCLQNSNHIIEKIKGIFWENKENLFFSELSESNHLIHVAVHVRRPNIFDDRIEGADTPHSYYLNLMDKIRRENGHVIFHIYSQGMDEDFHMYIGCGDTILHINEDIRTTFLGLISANILITSKSALSYCAALLTDGQVYFLPFLSDLNPYSNKWILTENKRKN